MQYYIKSFIIIIIWYCGVWIQADTIILEANRKLASVVVVQETFDEVTFYYQVDPSQNIQTLESRKVVRIEREKLPLDYQIAEDYFARNSFQHALDAYQNAGKNKTWYRQHCYYKTALCHLQLNQITQAITAYQLLLKEFPKTWYLADVYWDLGQCYQKLNKWAESAQYYNKSKELYLKRSPNSPRIIESQYYQALAVEKSSKKIQDAIQLYQKVIESSKKLPDINLTARLRLAICYSQAKNEKQAKVILLQIIKDIKPEQKNLLAETYVRLGQSYLQEKKIKEALLCYLRVIMLYPESKESNQAAFAGAIYCMDLLKKTNPEYTPRANQLRQLQQQKFPK